MILSCPLCQTRYLVPAGLFAAGPRMVRCARCSHSWPAEPPRGIEVVMPPQPEPEFTAVPPQPIPAGSNLPAVRGMEWRAGAWPGLYAAGILLCLAIIGAVWERGTITRHWPETAAVYDALGLHVYDMGQGLAFAKVHSELSNENGTVMLTVAGEIKNNSQKTLSVPAILATALDPDGDIMQSWQIEAPAATLVPAAAAPFRSSINAPKGVVRNVNLNFVEPVNDAN